MKSNKVLLIGFRTTGKSTVGKLLADKLNWSFLDMDFLITQEAGQEADKLTKNGTDWKKFRQIENEVLKEVLEMKNVVISCGGGVGVNDVISETGKTFGELNKEQLSNSKNSLVVLLQLDEKNIEERLRRQYKNKKIMPFLNSKKAKHAKDEINQEALIEKQIDDSMQTYHTREPLYNNLTDLKINTQDLNPEETASKIMEILKNEK